MKKLTQVALSLGLLGISATALMAQTADRIENKKKIVCAVPTAAYLGFLEVDDKGNWKGMDIDICRAIGVAMLGPNAKVEFSALSWADRFTALQSGAVDVVAMATGWSRGRDAKLGLSFSLPYYFGGAQLMAHADLGVTSAKDLNGATVCATAGTSVERATASYLTSLGIKYEMLTFENTADVNAAYTSNRCNVLAGWGPGNAVLRATEMKPKDNVLLPDVISNEPISAVIVQGDERMHDIVNWTISAMVAADEMGINQANVDAKKADGTLPADAQILLGAAPGMGDGLSLPDDWAYNVIKTVGAYSDVFARNLGDKSPYGLPAGANRATTQGGILWAPIID